MAAAAIAAQAASASEDGPGGGRAGKFAEVAGSTPKDKARRGLRLGQTVFRAVCHHVVHYTAASNAASRPDFDTVDPLDLVCQGCHRDVSFEEEGFRWLFELCGACGLRSEAKVRSEKRK